MKTFTTVKKFRIGSVLQLLFIFSCCLLNVLGDTGNDSQMFALKTVIDTNIKLTKSLAVSSQDSQVIVGGKDGELRVFDYETGELTWQGNQQNEQITSILWQNNRQGLVTISTDAQHNKSSAIQRLPSTFEQSYHWQFTQPIYNADTTSTRYDSYIAFNFMTRVQEYHLGSKKKTTTYQPSQDHRFVQMGYSSHYNYLFLSGNGDYMYAYKCGSNFRFYYGTSDIISRFETDKANHHHAPVIYKKQYSGFEILDPNYQFNVTFPKQKMDYYKYCPKDYILGIGLDSSIKIYSRDYLFHQHAVIDTFVTDNLFIVSVLCQNDRIIATASDNKIYVFEILSKESRPSQGWIWVVAVAGGVTLLMIIISIFALYRMKKNKQIKKMASPSLLSSIQKESVVSELII